MRESWRIRRTKRRVPSKRRLPTNARTQLWTSSAIRKAMMVVTWASGPTSRPSAKVRSTSHAWWASIFSDSAFSCRRPGSRGCACLYPSCLVCPPHQATQRFMVANFTGSRGAYSVRTVWRGFPSPSRPTRECQRHLGHAWHSTMSHHGASYASPCASQPLQTGSTTCRGRLLQKSTSLLSALDDAQPLQRHRARAASG
jgi:hypothetical protein